MKRDPAHRRGFPRVIRPVLTQILVSPGRLSTIRMGGCTYTTQPAMLTCDLRSGCDSGLSHKCEDQLTAAPRISKWRTGLFSRVSIENELTPHRVIESGRV
jgi:hypothetical protein